MSDWETKDWGRTRCTLKGDLGSLHELEVIEGGYCSVHYHRQRANRFIVKSGSIAVVSFYAWNIERMILTAGNVLDIPSHVVHQFQVISEGKVFEHYYRDGGKVRNDDIVRLCKGGFCPVEDLDKLAETILLSHVNRETVE